MPPELLELINDLVNAYDKDARSWCNNHVATMIFDAMANLLTIDTFNQCRDDMQLRIQRGINHRYTRAEFETYPTPVTERIAENAIRNIQRRIR